MKRTGLLRGVCALGIVFGAALVAVGCQENASNQECKAAAKARAHYFYGAGGKTAGSAKQTKNAGKHEQQASFEECKDHWSKSKANCISSAKNRNMLISCK